MQALKSDSLNEDKSLEENLYNQILNPWGGPKPRIFKPQPQPKDQGQMNFPLNQTEQTIKSQGREGQVMLQSPTTKYMDFL